MGHFWVFCFCSKTFETGGHLCCPTYYKSESLWMRHSFPLRYQLMLEEKYFAKWSQRKRAFCQGCSGEEVHGKSGRK